MDFDNCFISFNEFSPTEELKRLFQLVTHRLFSQAPSDSRMNFTVTQDSGMFIGHCQIRSRFGVFEANECSKYPEQLLAKIEKHIDRKLSGWRAGRFECETQAS